MTHIGTLYASKVLKKIADLITISESTREDADELREVARMISFRNDPLETLLSRYKKKPIKGISISIYGMLQEIQTGRTPQILTALLQEISPDYVELLRIKGLGAKKILLLKKELHIDSISSLEEAIRNNSILQVKGFAKKSTAQLLEAITFYKSVIGKIRLDQHELIIQTIKEELLSFQIESIEIKTSLEKEEVFEKTELSCNAMPSKDALLSLQELDFTIVSQNQTSVTLEKNTHPIYLTIDDPDNFGENKAAAKKKLLTHSISINDIRGIIHTHTTYSDGIHSIIQMRDACQSHGYQYIAISDHSKSAAYANGLSPERLLNQINEIKKLNEEKTDFKIYACTESDILKNGDLDYDENLLRQLDFVISSVHSHFDLSSHEMTERICTAIKNPFTSILAHPTGRLLLERKGYEVDIEEILSCISSHKKIIELNCNPKRLDLSWRHLGLAKEMGIKICLSPDAHSVDQIEYITYGLHMARKAGLQKKDIINCLHSCELDNLLATLKN